MNFQIHIGEGDLGNIVSSPLIHIPSNSIGRLIPPNRMIISNTIDEFTFFKFHIRRSEHVRSNSATSTRPPHVR